MIKILIILTIPTMIYSQTNLSKDEIYKSWTKTTNRTKTQFDYRFHFDSIVVSFIDSLKSQGIDTIGAYGEQYVGSFTLDSCQSGLIPWMTAIQWIDKGKTYHRMLMESCSFETKSINSSVLIRYYINNTHRLVKEHIMPNITSVSRDKNGELEFSFSMVDHTTHYLIYCDLNNHSRFITFEEYDFENEESLFHSDNNNSIIKSWRDMILNQLYELE